MMFGCPVIASTADAVRETCGGAAAYFDPLDAQELRKRMLDRMAIGRISAEERSVFFCLKANRTEFSLSFNEI